MKVAIKKKEGKRSFGSNYYTSQLQSNEISAWFGDFMACQLLLEYLMLKSVFSCKQLYGFK